MVCQSAETAARVVHRADEIGSSFAEAMLARFLTLGRKARYERAGFQLYGAAVIAARSPYLYAELGTPDTLDGRFDVIALHVFLLIQRLKREPDARSDPRPGGVRCDVPRYGH